MTQEGRLYLTPNATESPESAAHAGIAAAVLETVEEAIQLVRQLLVRLPSNNLESVSVAPLFRRCSSRQHWLDWWMPEAFLLYGKRLVPA